MTKVRAVHRVNGAPWRVVAALTTRELGELRESFRYRAVVAVIVLVMTVSAVLGAARHRAATGALPDVLERYAEELDGATVGFLAELRHPAIKPPWRLAFLAEGDQHRTPNLYWQALTAWEEPFFESRHHGSEGLQEAESLDWTFVLRTVLSLAAFLLGYDALRGPRQHRLLELLLAQAVDRWQVLTAKLIAIWSSLALPFLGGALLSLAVVVVYGGLKPSPGELAKVALMALLGLWAAGLYATGALLVSARSREANRSLAALALLWVAAVVVLPAASGLVTPLLRPLPDEQEISLEAIRHELDLGPSTGTDWRPPEWGRDDGYAVERRSARIQNRRFELEEAQRRRQVLAQLEQAAVARRLASLSPMLLVTDVAERLVGSGRFRDRRFVVEAWAFRDVLAAHVRELDRRDPMSPHLEFFNRYLSSQPVRGDAVPRFTFSEISVGEGLRLAALPLAALAAITLALAVAAYLSFERYQVRPPR